MKPVVAPLQRDSQGEAIANLHEILQFFIDHKFIKIPKEELDKLTAEFSAEKRKQVYGERTAWLIRQFRLQNNLAEGNDVDEQTAIAINSLLEETDTKLRVTGTVSSAEGKLFAGILVKAWHREPGVNELLGEVQTDRQGQYELFYTDTNKDGSKREITNLQVFIYDENNEEITHSIIHNNAPRSIAIDIILPAQSDNLSEYERMAAELTPLLKGLSLEKLTEEDIDMLVSNSTIPRERIVLLKQAYVSALKYAIPDIRVAATGHSNFPIPALVFYGWFRQSLPTEPGLLFALPLKQLVGSIMAAVKSRIIPEQNPDNLKKITEAISRIGVENVLAPALDAVEPSLGDVLNTIPGKLPYDKQFIVANVLRDKSDPGIPVRERLMKAGLEEKQASAVENTLAFQSFSKNFLPLIKTLQDDPEIESLHQLALKVSKEDFARKIADNNAYPQDEKPDDFADRLYTDLFRAEPTAMLRNMLKDDKIPVVEDAATRTHIDKVLSNLPESFNIRTTSVYEVFKDKKVFEEVDPEYHDKVKAELKSLQRITAISPAPEVVPVLMKARVTAAFVISAMPEKQFVQTYSASFGKNGEMIAKELHANAVNAQIRNENALISMKEVKQGTGISMVDKTMKVLNHNYYNNGNNGFDEVFEQNNLSWDYLFGDADFCECGECTSVYSASAYFVELLQYLRNNNLDPDATGDLEIKLYDPKNISDTPLQKLFGRRPDLMCLQLTCKNTNTILPYVDLVNEIMESYVALQKTLPFNVKENETSGELLAQAHHTNYKAYELLHNAVYPFSLPYNQPVDAIRLYLSFLGTSFYELINTFRSARDTVNVLEPLSRDTDPKIPLSAVTADLDASYSLYLQNAADAEYLGLTQEEYIILTKEAFVAKKYWDEQSLVNGNTLVHTPDEYLNRIGVRPVHEYYGYSLDSSMLSIDETTKEGLTFVKDQFLKRTGLQYLELVELLKTRSLNPNVPQQHALYIMDRIQLSYRFLQSLVIPGAQTPEDKYKIVIVAIYLISQPVIENALNGLFGLNICNTEEAAPGLTVEEIKTWVFDHFEKTGKIIVLDNGIKCIDGKLSLSNGDNLIDTGVSIWQCKIINDNTGQIIGSIDKATGLVTMDGQSDGNWTKIVFTGKNGEKGTFVTVGGKTYLVTTKIETCDLETVRLVHLDGSPLITEEYDHMHRFIRLWRRMGWSINETDNAITGFSNSGKFEISPFILHQLACVKKLYEQTGLELTRLLTFWTNISTAGEKSLYKRLFLTHNLVNLDGVFHDANGRYLPDPAIKIADHIPVLMAALNLKAEDIDAIQKYEAIEQLTLENVSTLYRYRLLSKILGIRAADLINLLSLFTNPFDNGDATLLFLEQWKKMEDAGFTYLQLNYLITGLDDPKKPLAPAKKTILQLAKALYDGLNTIQQVHKDLAGNTGSTDPAEQARERQVLATTDLVKEKAALLYDQETVEKIIGILEGTTVYSAECTAEIKDTSRPIPLVPPDTIQDYEYFQPENYPLLRRKIKYDSVKGSLQIKGVLTVPEQTELDTVMADLLPALALDDALKRIKGQQKRSANEIFSGIFAAAEIDVLSGPDSNSPANNDSTAPVKREKFLQIFLPYLRKELSYRFITDTLSAQTSLGVEMTDLLLTEILKTGTPAAPLYTLLANLHKTTNPAIPGWDGYLMSPPAGQYTFIVKNKATKPVLNVDDVAVNFVERYPREWYSDVQKLQQDKLYKLSVQGMVLEDVYWKTATSAAGPIPSVSLLPAYTENTVTGVFTLLQKSALLINGFKLSADEINYLSANKADFENLDFNRIEVKHFFRLASYTRLRDSLQKSKIDLLDFFRWTKGPAAQAIKLLNPDERAKKLSEKIEELSGWKKERIGQLLRADRYNLLLPESFCNEINLHSLRKALEVADKIHISIDRLFDWGRPGLDFGKSHTIAESIRQAIRAQYQQEDWEQVVKPLNDKLRENQKNALISYLLVQTPLIRWGVTDADGLFEFFLIDVQMDACMETSRIKQAISSVQLFIQRCFLGLEKAHNDILPNQRNEHMNIEPGLLDRKRWEWMQRYRVWEANRKVFLYPENWIESNLRDDKSHFFRELESELLQKDISKQNVQDALKVYLYKLDEVANMEVAGVYVEQETYTQGGQQYKKGKKLHVFSRTRNAPYFFFYRWLDIEAGNWYPWEKVQVDIPSYDVEDLQEFTYMHTHYSNYYSNYGSAGKSYNVTTSNYVFNTNYKKIIGNGSYLTPIVWNGRLLLFFPQFTKKTKSPESTAGSKSVADMSADSPDSIRPMEYWEIKMAWSEYRNGKWTQKQVSKDVIADIPDIATYTKFWRDFNAVAKAKKKIDDAWEDRQVKYKAAWLTRNRWSSSTQAEKQRNWDRYVQAWDKEVESADYFDLIMDSTNYQSVFYAYITAYNQFKNDKPPVSADISKYAFETVLSNTGNLVGIRVAYLREGISNMDHVDKGFFEFDGSKITASRSQNYANLRSSSRIEYFHHYESYVTSLQTDDNSSHVFNDGLATTYTPYPLYGGVPVSFNHSDRLKLLGVINSQQLDKFFRFPLDGPGRNTDKDDVFGGYDHDSDTQTPNSYHELKRPYSIYNWELFFHTPMMLADALSKSQQFEEAMKWYHYVFNPVADGNADDRFWQFIPFKEMDAKHVLNAIFNKLRPNEPNTAINEWRNNPFNPHLVARSRPVAYMKWVVMKYIDNLIAWGDYLFRQDTIESINQATQLYVLAGHILGQRPQVIPKRGKVKTQTYISLLDKWDAFSNAMVELEIALPFSSQIPQAIGNDNGVVGLANIFGFASTNYFCIPNNPKLMGYWDTIADRLFKIRHCENIEGVFRRLPLFEPPIDPAVLVNAVAQGVSISSVINDLNTPMPNYRFYYLLQKALELCNELKSLGGAMLSAIEKKDNETIALLRSRHESSMLTLVMEVKKQQLEEAQKALDGLRQNRKSPEHRMKYYLQLIGEDESKVPGNDTEFSEIANTIEMPVTESGAKLISYEKEDMDKSHAAADWQIGIGVVEALASVFHAIPQFMLDVKPMGVGAGAGFGGSNLGNLTQAIAKGMQTYSTRLSYESSTASKKGGFLRAMQERTMQANAAGYEIKQIDKQIISQQIRIGIANLEISNHQKQIENSQEIEDFLTNKYSNEELYSWMKSSLNSLYHQAYNMAFELAKKAEKVYRFERGMSSSNFIRTDNWDAGYNGLLSGEKLYAGLKQLEAAYQENQGYDYEITKHVSLKQINPMAIYELRQTGSCEFVLPEVLFDMDYPGHYKRRIKSVSISVPCIAGPYTGLNGTLRLLENKFRNVALAKSASDYPEKTDETDDRFQGFIIPINAIAASSGQNDSGMFELNFKDERYLPFEGAGVISRWRFELPSFKQFDYNTISDLVVHIRYTSVEGGGRLKSSAEGSVRNYMSRVEELGKDEGLFAVIDMKHDMPDAWHKLKTSATVDLKITGSMLPYFTKLFTGTRIINTTLIARLNDSTQTVYTINVPDAATALSLDKDLVLKLYAGVTDELSLNTLFQLSIGQADLAKLEELILLVKYSV